MTAGVLPLRRATDAGQHWTEAGVFEVADGVHRIPLPMPGDGLAAINVYALETGKGLVLIDTGQSSDAARETLARGLAALGESFESVHAVAVTHVHADHYSNAAEIRRCSGAEVALHIDERESLRRAAEPEFIGHEPHLRSLSRAGATGWTDDVPARPEWRSWSFRDFEDPDRWLVDGDSVAEGTLEVVHTPGHTRGNCVFVDPSRGAVFTGDHVLPRITPSVGFESVLSVNPLGSYLGSLGALLDMPDARMFPAHGPVVPVLHARVRELIAHHETRLSGFADAVARGAHTAYDVADVSTWTRHKRALAELDLFNRTLAVNETLAHLELLVVRGLLTEDVDDQGVAMFRMVEQS